MAASEKDQVKKRRKKESREVYSLSKKKEEVKLIEDGAQPLNQTMHNNSTVLTESVIRKQVYKDDII